MGEERIRELEEDILRMEHQKLELIRATSTEIERLRTIIRALRGKDRIETLGKLVHEPMMFGPVRGEHESRVSGTAVPTVGELVDSDGLSSSPMKQGTPDATTEDDSKQDTLLRKNTPGGPDNSEDEDSEDEDSADLSEGAAYAVQSAGKTRKSIEGDSAEEAEDEFREDDSETPASSKRQAKKDTTFRLSNQRMSHTGFEFSDFGFISTDFSLLSRGHNSWVNQVLHHPVQNGICLSASDDWSIMFWRFQKRTEREKLEQEKMDVMIDRLRQEAKEAAYGGASAIGASSKLPPMMNSNAMVTLGTEATARIEDRIDDSKYNLTAKHLTGEVSLYPVMKINTGLEVKAIALSREANLLACTCYDDEEDEGNPELQLYYDESYQWQFREDLDSEERVVKRHIIPLDFEPMPRSIAVSSDGRRVFLSMIASKTKLKELKEEREAEEQDSEDEDSMLGDPLSGPSASPGITRPLPEKAYTMAVVDVVTREVTKCDRINDAMVDEEFVTSCAMSPDGTQVAMGTSCGRLIVCTTQVLIDPTAAKINEDKWWISHDIPMDEVFVDEKRITSTVWSADSLTLVTGHGNGHINVWRKKPEKRMTVGTSQAIARFRKFAAKPVRQVLFGRAWSLTDVHIEAVNTLSLSGSVMISGSDDGKVIIHDMYNCFTYEGSSESSIAAPFKPVSLAVIPNMHMGRMINSVALCQDYNETYNLIPTAGAFMVTSGADNVLHCVSTNDMIRKSFRQKISQ